MKHVEPRLLVFDNMSCNLNAIARVDDAQTTLDGATAMVVTVLEDSLDENGCLPQLAWGGGDAWRWDPAFWDRKQVVAAAIETLAAGFDSPVLWVYGEYLYDELQQLEACGQLPGRLGLSSLSVKRRCNVAAILPDQNAHSFLMPFHQGFGHFPGIRFAFYDKDDQPTTIYEQWLADHTAGPKSAIDNWLDQDDLCIGNPIAWISPFGDENRQHALIWKSGWSHAEILEALSSKLSYSVIHTKATEKEFRQWEWSYDLPPDVVHLDT